MNHDDNSTDLTDDELDGVAGGAHAICTSRQCTAHKSLTQCGGSEGPGGGGNILG